MKKLLFPVFCAMILAGALSSCKYFPVDPIDPIDPIDPPGKDTNFVINPLVNTAWKLENYSLLDRKAHAVSVEGTFTLKFSSYTEAGGQADCNSYGVEYKADAQSITFNNLITTEAACGPNSFNFYGALASASSYTLRDNHLYIVYDNGTKELQFSSMFTQPVTPNYIQLLESFSNVKFRLDPFRILDVQKMDDSHVMITVEYGGGCHENHEFTLYGSKEFTVGNATDWADVMMSHDAKDDMCDALIVKSFVYDVSPLIKAQRETGSGNRLVLKFSQAPNSPQIDF